MLMFENGLLASFIPELLMVLAYLFCFVAPGIKHEKLTPELASKVIQASSNQSDLTSVYKVTSHDFNSINQLAENQLQIFINSKGTEKITVPERIFGTTTGQNQALFSRPPPSL